MQYARDGGAITITCGAVLPKDVTRAKGMGVSPNCEKTLACAQQFLVNGELYVCLGLLWVGFGKIYKTSGKNGKKKKKPDAPLLCLAVPQSCVQLDSDRPDLFVPHLVLFVAHYVLDSAVFPCDQIRCADIDKLAKVFSNLCTTNHKSKDFWRQVPRK